MPNKHLLISVQHSEPPATAAKTPPKWCMCTCMCMQVRACGHSTLTCMPVRACVHVQARLAFVCACMHARDHADVRTARTTHARMHARTNTHTHARTHTRTQICGRYLVVFEAILARGAPPPPVVPSSDEDAIDDAAAEGRKPTAQLAPLEVTCMMMDGQTDGS